MSVSILSQYDIWNDDLIVPAKLNQPLQEMINNQEFQLAKNYIKALRLYDTNRNLEVKLNQLESHLKQSINLTNCEVEGYQRVDLVPYKGKNESLPENIDWFSLPEGKYIKFFGNDRVSNFKRDFGSLSESLKKLLCSKNFNFAVSKQFPLRVFVMRNCKVHDIHWRHYAISDSDYIYDTNNSAQGAFFSHINFDRLNRYKIIRRAFVLPVDAVSINYYHNLSECFFGLRYFDYNKYPDVPIIYTQDKFNLIPYISKVLGIDIGRFLSIHEVSDSIIEQAVCFYRSGEFWDPTIYEFARKLIPQAALEKRETFRKVYISRLKSSRAIINERDVELYLKSQGFEIIYAEELSFEQQIVIFSQAYIVVSSHGAGLANICFMRPSTHMIEIFRSDMIKPDFYLRSIHNNLKYRFLILDNGSLDFEQLESILINIDSEAKK